MEQLPSQIGVNALSSKMGYLRELKAELSRMTWTAKGELIVSTKIVVGATFALGLGIYGIDLLIKMVLTVVGF